MKLFLLTNWRWLTLVVALAAGLVLAFTLLTTSGTRQPGELSRSAERRVVARRDSALARAARLDQLAQASAAHAAAAYDSAATLQDSATYYRQHEKPIRLAAADTAQYRRLLAEIFGH